MRSDSPKACVLIPARFASSRFPGKPLVKLLGKPMILWVCELSAEAVGSEHVYVATDDERIAKAVKQSGFSALMTGSSAMTGTDRLAQASEMVDYDIYVNVQGDEPMVQPRDIRRCIHLKTEQPELIINGFCSLGRGENPQSVNIPKVITNEQGIMVYMSRSPLPGFKDPINAPQSYMKQVCIYGFSRQDLREFAAFGRKSQLEAREDIEILRFLEMSKKVLMYECQPGSMAVDVPEDVSGVEKALQESLA